LLQEFVLQAGEDFAELECITDHEQTAVCREEEKLKGMLF